MADQPPPAALTTGLASRAYGFAAFIDGILNPRTATDTRNGAAVNALYIAGFSVHSNCQDSECDCMVRALAQLRPGIRIVPVTIEAQP